MRVLRITPLFDWRGLDPPPALAQPQECAGGHAVQVLRMTEATARLGVEQAVVTLRAAGGPRRGRLPAGVPVHGVARGGLPGVHRRNLAWLLATVAGLPRRRRERWDVVHVHASGIVEPLLAALAARALLRRPLVLTLHHSAQATYVARSRRDAAVQVLTRWAEREAIRRAARTLTLTRRVAGVVGGEALPDSIDARAFAAAADARAGEAFARGLGVPPDAPVALYAGRISAEKGWPDMLALAAAIPGLHVIVCGDGPDREAMAARAGERVHLAGAVPPATVAAAMTAADVLVLPSVLEELGSVLIEAMAVGLVSVAYAAGGVPEAVEEGVTGLLVAPGDVGALIAAVRRALEDDELRMRAATDGPRIAADRFDSAVVARRLTALYAELAAR